MHIMPYKFQTNKIPLPAGADRRVKIPKSEHAVIRQLFKEQSIRSIARAYKVDKRTIQFILYPERIAQSRANREWRDYYNKDKHRETTKEHRRYKQKITTKHRTTSGTD